MTPKKMNNKEAETFVNRIESSRAYGGVLQVLVDAGLIELEKPPTLLEEAHNLAYSALDISCSHQFKDPVVVSYTGIEKLRRAVERAQADE